MLCCRTVFCLSSPLLQNFLRHFYDYRRLSLELALHFFLCIISVRLVGCYILPTLVTDKIRTLWFICCLLNRSNVVKDDWILLLWVTFSVLYGCSFLEWHTVHRNTQTTSRTKFVCHSISGHSVGRKTRPILDQ